MNARIKKKTTWAKSILRQIYYTRTSNRIERVRLTAYIMAVLIVMCAVPLHFIGVIGMYMTSTNVITLLFILSFLIPFILFLARKMSLKAAFATSTISGQLLQSIGMVMLAVVIPDTTQESMLVNIIVSYMVLLYLTFGFMSGSALIVTAICLTTTSFIAYYPPSANLLSHRTWLLMTIIEATTCLFAVIEHSAVTRMRRDTEEYKGIQDRVLHTFGVTRTELLTLLQLTQSNRVADMTAFFKHLNERSRHNIIEAAINAKDKEMSERDDMSQIFPVLTDTELQVARLIIEGKSKKDIGTILGKSPNNIGTVRVNIRRKLGLTTDQDLRGYMMSKMEAEE